MIYTIKVGGIVYDVEFKELEMIEIANDLIEELANGNTANVTAEISMDSKKVAHGLRKSQLTEEFEEMDARIKERLNLGRY